MNPAVTKKTACAETKWPVAPMITAAAPFPADAKRALRPSRAASAYRPTSPRLMAAIAGESTEVATACKAREAATAMKTGHTAIIKALTPMAATAPAAADRSDLTPSTSQPPGI